MTQQAVFNSDNNFFTSNIEDIADDIMKLNSGEYVDFSAYDDESFEFWRIHDCVFAFDEKFNLVFNVPFYRNEILIIIHQMKTWT